MSAGKGKGPIKGYNYKNWNANYDEISWDNKRPTLNKKENNKTNGKSTKNTAKS